VGAQESLGGYVLSVLRAYDLPMDEGSDPPGWIAHFDDEVPTEAEQWLDARLLYAPTDFSRRTASICWFRASDRQVTIAQTSATVTRHVLAHPKARLLDCALRVFPAASEVLPPIVCGPGLETVFSLEVQTAAGTLTLDELLDTTLAEALGDEVATVKAMRKSTFGSVVLVPKVHADVGSAETAWSGPGLRPGHLVRATRNRILAEVPTGEDARSTLFGYEVMAAFAARSRHLARRLQSGVSDAATTAYDDHWKALSRAAEVQREAVHLQAEMSPADVFADDELFRLLRLTMDDLVMTSFERDQLGTALSSLDSFVNGLFAVAVDRTQGRFAMFGAVFALLSVVYASLALITVRDGEPIDFSLLATANLLMLVALGVLWKRHRRPRAS
jgi:hypothetical protein